MLVGNLLQALYNTVDAVWVGRFLGASALGAVAISFPIIFALVSLLMGLTMATTTLVSQFRGAGDEAGVRRTISNSLRLLGGLGILLSAVGFFLRVPVLRLIGTPDEILPQASSYLGVFLVGMLAMFLYNVGSAVLRGLGDSRTPLRFLAIATAINIVLDPLLILGVGPFPKMGIAGAALATVLAQAVSSVLVLRHLALKTGLLRVEGKLWELDGRLSRLTFVIGLPAGAQQFVVSVGMLTITSIINRFGATVVAAFGAAARLDQFAHMPAMSLGLAVSAMVGQNLGAGRDERVREIVRWALMLTGGITAGFLAVALLLPRQVLSLFTAEAAVLAEGVRYLRIVSWAYVPFALSFVFTGVLRGAGDTVPTMIITVSTLWLFRVPLASYLSGAAGLGSRGIWLANAIAPALSMLLNLAYYSTGRWRSKVAVRRAPGSTGAPRPPEVAEVAVASPSAGDVAPRGVAAEGANARP
jgi:putative MATE family efflux protein